jgi:hypothetical protein
MTTHAESRARAKETPYTLQLTLMRSTTVAVRPDDRSAIVPRPDPLVLCHIRPRESLSTKRFVCNIGHSTDDFRAAESAFLARRTLRT